MKHEEKLIEISRKIVDLLGLNFQPNQFVDMERRLKATAKELKIEPVISAIYSWIFKPELTNIEFKTLSANLTIGETYFFRERKALDLFKNKIIPNLLNQRQNSKKQLKIWSAGCSSGEEPYTLAIILKEYFPELYDWEITIMATDISPVAIQKALKGEYTDWSFRENDPYIKNKYFTYSNKLWKLNSDIKKMVTFSYLNLSKNSYPSSITHTENMDVIFCRNVMMYFTQQVIKEVSNRFYNSINENGWLITSQVELNDEYFSNFERILFEKAIFYQKTNHVKEKQNIKLPDITSVLNTKTLKTKDKKPEKPKIPHKIEKKNKQSALSNKTTKDNELIPLDLYQKGEYQKCINSILQLCEHGKINNEIFNLLVKSVANSSNFIEGDKILKKILSTTTANAEMYYLYANFLMEKNEAQQAESLLKKAIYLNHKHVLSHFMLGDIALKNDKKQISKKHYETVIELLEEYQDNDIISDSEGLTAESLKALAASFINSK